MPAARIPRNVAQRSPKPGPRRHAWHLSFVRQLPCVACGQAAPSEAAHVRSGSDGGTGIKPSDRYSLPLCSECHAMQHQFGELRFWSVLWIDPLNVAFGLWAISGDIKAGERIVFRARQYITLANGSGLSLISVMNRRVDWRLKVDDRGERAAFEALPGMGLTRFGGHP